MFKPLLKSIPSLSGNMKIVCNLEGYDIDSSNRYIYNCNVNNAYLTSISSNLYDKNIPLNLKNNSFEYDVKQFYLYYADVFYKNNFNYSKVNIPIIDFTSTINNSNTDFKFGCKRVSYLKSGNTLAFYSPIYVESKEDLEGKYFIITCIFNKVYQLKKYIKIKVSNINEGNSLADYLVRYTSKLDDRVINCSSSYKNIYYGISLKKGGFVKVEDNISSNLYNKYYTINDFDATLTNGFKRNYLMMKQVIPLSFYFDPNNLLNDFEKNIYNNAEVIVQGRWYDENDNEIPFYDFSDDYSKFEDDIYNLYYEDKFKYINTGNNIMNLGYPACNESSSENYKYINTVAKNYNRWKLKYSNDDYPYIINNNYAFSFNQGSLYAYKEFPILYSPIRAYAKLVSNTEYNLLFDYDDIYGKDGYHIINEKQKYFELYNNNFISNFFDLFTIPGFKNKYDLSISEIYSKFVPNYSDYIHYDENQSNAYSQFLRIPKKYVDLDNLDSDYQLELVAYDYIDLKDFDLDNIDSFDFYNETRNLYSYQTYICEYLKLYYDKYIINNTNNTAYVLESEYGRLRTDEENQDYYKVYPLLSNGTVNFDVHSEDNSDKDMLKKFINYNNYRIVEQLIKKTIKPEYLYFSILLYDHITWQYRLVLRPIIKQKDNIINIEWYKITKNELVKDNSLQITDIFDNNHEDNWSNVNSDGKVYHKGILYDLNSIYNENLSMDFKIDKFGVFVKPTFDYTLSYDFNDIYKKSKTIFTYNFSNEYNHYDLKQIYNYYQLNTKSSYLINYGVVKKDDNGQYVDICSLNTEINNSITQFEKGNNIYIDVNDIYIMNLLLNNIKIDLNDPIVIDGQEISLSLIDGYKVIDVHNASNIYNQCFQDIKREFNIDNIKHTIDNMIFRDNIFIEDEKIYWAKNKLYFSIYPNKAKFPLIDNYQLLENISENDYVVLYIKTQFVRYDNDLDNYLSNIGNIAKGGIKEGREIHINNDAGHLNTYLNYYKYYYCNGLYDQKNKILYTSPVFCQLNEITDNYGQYKGYNKDKNFIYVDPYNLVKVYRDYLGKDFTKENIEKNVFFCNFLNKNHLILYLQKLYKNEDPDSESNDINVIDTIYIKIRNFNNCKIDLHDDANTDFSTISIQDDYVPISNFNIKSINDISIYLNFDNNLNCFYFNDQYLSKYFDNILQASPNDDYMAYVMLNIYNIKYFEICFRKQMIYLNEDLYNLIINRKNDDIFKDLYLYHIEDPKDYRCPMHYCDDKTPIMNGKELISSDDFDYINTIEMTLDDYNTEYTVSSSYFINFKDMYYTNSITNCLYPYFNDIFDENKTDTKIYSDYFINNIVNCNGLYRYNEASINFLAYIPQNVGVESIFTNDELSDLNMISNEIDKEKEFVKITQSKLSNYRYSLVNDLDDTFVTAADFMTYNICKDKDNINEYSNLITYYYQNTYYGFYIINSSFDNTNNTLNIQNEDLDYINCVDYINGIHVSYIEEFGYLGKIYKNIVPYLNTSNPVKFVINNVNTLLKPQMYKLKNNIKQYPNTNNNVIYSYTLYNNPKKDYYVELLRYFDDIVPYIPKVNYINSYYLYFKNTNKIIENDLQIKNRQFIMYQDYINLNKFSYISYFDNDCNIHKYEPTEYKYYNDNRFFNLEKEILINLNKDFTEEDIVQFENDEDKIFELFRNYINNAHFDSLPYRDKINNYLFLYKKYQVKFIHDFKYINSSNKKIYSLTIKFNLL